ncbi:MAG: MalY/PatB family protein [Gammaproteobacteria bacterium]
MKAHSYDFDRPIDRRPHWSQKWNKYRHLEQDILPMWLGDTDFEPPEEVLSALKKRLEHPVLGYTEAPDSLVEVIIERLSRLYQWQIQAEWLVFLPGLVPALNLAVRNLSAPQRSVLLPEVIYGPFSKAVEQNGRRSLRIPQSASSICPVYTPDAIRATIQTDTDLLLFCNPQNPGGSVYSVADLEQIGQICLDRNVVICSDDVHCDLVYDGQYRPIASLSPELARQTVTLLAPSKAFNVAGLSLGFAVVPDPEIRMRFLQGHGMSGAVSLLSYTAAEAAYRHGSGWLEQMKGYLKSNRDWLFDAMSQLPGVQPVLSESTFFMWINLQQLNIDHLGSYFERFGLGLSDGAEFGAPQCVRINFGTRRALVEEGFARFKQGVMSAQQRSNTL